MKQTRHSIAAIIFGRTMLIGPLVALSCCGTLVGQQLSTTIANATSSSKSDAGVAQPLEFVYAAAPLSSKYIVADQGQLKFAAEVPPNSPEATNFVSSAISDSMVRCQNFVNSITAGQALQNTVFDVASIITSALASVFVPVNTVRALAASSTISQGTKGAINGDFFQTLTTQILSQKMREIYYSKLDDYRDKNFPPQTNINAAKELTKIVEIHSNCSIPAAIAALTTAPGYSPNLPTVLTSVVPGAIYKLNDGSYVKIIQNSDANKTLNAKRVDSSGNALSAAADPVQNLSAGNMLNWLNQMQATAVLPKSAS